MNRKTGLTLPDTGIRDEHGLEPADHLFSSPEKPLKHINGNRKNANATLSSEEDMDVAESETLPGDATFTRTFVDLLSGTIPEPAEVIAERKSATNTRLPPPRAKSPIKTFLQSPARRHPSLGPASSPMKEIPRASSTAAPVRRRLDFSANGSFDESQDASAANMSPQKRGNSAMLATSTAKLTNEGRQSFFNKAVIEDDSVQEESLIQQEDSYALINGGDDEVDEPMEEEPEPEEEPVPSKNGKGRGKEIEANPLAKRRGRPKKQAVTEIQEVEEELPEESIVEIVEPVKKKPGRPKKVTPERIPSPILDSPEAQPKKRGRPKRQSLPEEPEEDPRPQKRTRLSLGAPIPEPPKPRGRPKATSALAPKDANAKVAKVPQAKGPKAGLATIAESDSPVIIRGPPLPKKTGLAISRRENPLDGGFNKTRSGRNSFKPVAYWKNESIEYEKNVHDDPGAHIKFVTRTVKDILRVADEDPPKRPRAKSQAPRSKKRAASPESEDEADLEPWELEPGHRFGLVRKWDPVDPLGNEAEEVEEEVGISAPAIITREIPNATFKFAKTLTLPFFGSGMVDLPPGGIKKQKNSRKMQMVFFVHRGRVSVTVNDTAFRIGQGGMWMVPRGKDYQTSPNSDWKLSKDRKFLQH